MGSLSARSAPQLAVHLAGDFDGRGKGFSALVPGRRADLARILPNEFECLDFAEYFARTPADVIGNNIRGAEHPVGINNERRALGHASIFLVYSEFPRETAVMVRGHGVAKPLDELLRVEPALMGVDGVGGDAHDLGAEGRELTRPAVHIRKFRRANKGKVLRIPKENQPLTRKVGLLDVPDLVLRGEICLKREVGERLIYSKHKKKRN